MPVQQPNIDAEIAYILQNWIQNNNQLVTGTIGQNVVWNLAQFIKQNPENWNTAKVITAPTVNYTALASDCIIIFTNNSTGTLDYLTNPNIWNKYYIFNQTDNVRTVTGSGFYDINGTLQTGIGARQSVLLAKGNDGFWYSILGVGGSFSGVKPPLIGVVGGGSADDPVAGASVFQSNKLIGLAAANAQKCQISLDSGLLSNYGNNISFILDNVVGEIDISPNKFQTGSPLYIDLNQ